METIGSLEEIILIILMRQEKINSVDVAKEYQQALQKSISIPAIHVVLKRMEKKGWVKSEFGSPTSERGGRRKRLYWATPSAFKLLNELNEVKTKLWSGVTKTTMNYAYP